MAGPNVAGSNRLGAFVYDRTDQDYLFEESPTTGRDTLKKETMSIPLLINQDHLWVMGWKTEGVVQPNQDYRYTMTIFISYDV